MMIDVDRCISCGSCQLACQLEHSRSKEEPGPFMPIAITPKGGKGDRLIVYAPLTCRHCDSPCDYYSSYNFWINCPDIKGKTEKIERGEIKSCDFCIDRTQRGLWPACATRCTMKTIYYGPARDIIFASGEKRLSGMGDVVITE
jgi:Fe-S-cluster-containing dehydrogenase component